MHDWGDMLIQAGFAEPVMDMERITLTYATPTDLLKDLRLLGRNLHHQRCQNLRGRAWKQALESALLALAKPDQAGRLVLTVEVIYGHALKPLPKVRMAEQSSVTLAQMKTLLGQTKGNTPLE
jgi:malonyl-CoA O-methyltransferase